MVLSYFLFTMMTTQVGQNILRSYLAMTTLRKTSPPGDVLFVSPPHDFEAGLFYELTHRIRIGSGYS